MRELRALCSKGAVLACVVVLVSGILGAPAVSARVTPTTTLPVRGGSFTFLYAFTAPTSFDPADLLAASSSTGAQYLAPVYGYLLYEDFTTGKVVPQMAESMTTTDATHWVLKLRSGVQFSDGTAYDANAVMADWKRIATLPRRAAASTIASMTAPDPLTLNITLKAPDNAFDRVVAQYLTFIPSATAIAANPAQFTRRPIGAGPFTLQSYGADKTAVYLRNPGYWDQPRPYLDQLTIKDTTDDAQRYDAFASGAGNLATVGVARVRAAELAGYPVSSIGTPGGGNALLWNTTKAPFNDPIARQAVEHALDPKAANRTLYLGAELPMPSLFKKGSPFYTAEAKIPRYDPKQAQALFDQYAAKTGGPMTVNFILPSGPSDATATSFYTAQFARYTNVTVKITTVIPASYDITLLSGQYDMAGFTWSAADPEALIGLYGTGGTSNFGKYSNPLVDQLFDEASATTNPEQRVRYFSQAQKILVSDDAIAYLMGQLPNLTASTGNVRGIDQHAGDGLWLWDRIWLAPSR